MDKLKFTKMKDNAKLNWMENGWSLSLPSGHSCPGASKCLSKVIVENGKAKLVDGKDQEFRCFSATLELRYPNVRDNRWYNFNLLKQCKTVEEFVRLIDISIPKNAEVIRYHIGGDFYNVNYFKAAMIVAELYPWITFYAYTKSLHFIKDIYVPYNFKLNASIGGRFDNLIDELKLKHAKVFFSEEAAAKANYKIDHTDELAFKQDNNFGLLLHATQAAGTEASKAWTKIQKTVGGYK